MKRLSVILGIVILFASAARADVEFYDVSELIPGVQLNAAAVAWGDVNTDGRLDLLVGDGGTDGSRLFLNTPTGFQMAGSLYDLSQMVNVRTLQFVDYNVDGRLDVFCLTNDAHCARLYRQTSTHHFEEVALLPDTRVRIPLQSAVWSDMDSDGDLDLLLSNTPEAPFVSWLRQSNYGFELVSSGIFPAGEAAASTVCLVDFDRDNDLDVFLGYSQISKRAKLFRNDDDIYTPWQEKASFPVVCGRSGVVWADFNNDQYPDVALPGAESETFLLQSVPSDQARSFIDITSTPGFSSGMAGGRYVHSADFNLDGYQDLFVVCNGNLSPRLMLNQAGASWTTQSFRWDTGNHRPTTDACALCDFDGDNDVDIVLAQGDDGVRLLRNETKSEQEWIGVALLGTDINTPARDCQVTMEFEECKQMGSTSETTCSPGQDGSILYLVSTSDIKSTVGHLDVAWPNGVLSRYLLSELHLNEVNTFHQPYRSSSTSLIGLPPPETQPVVDLSNSPNPFNPTTTLNFSLSTNEYVRLTVYDMLGREVALLADAPYQAGNYSLTFNAANLPSGLYFARLTAGPETKLQRMLLLK